MRDEVVKAYWQGYNTAKKEIAREIFEEIEKHTFSYGYAVRSDMSVAKTRRIDEDCLVKLIKKYIEGDKK